MKAGRVSAGVAAVALPHISKRWVVVTIRAEDVALAFDAGGEVEKFEIVKRAFEFLVKLDVAILRQRERFVALKF